MSTKWSAYIETCFSVNKYTKHKNMHVSMYFLLTLSTHSDVMVNGPYLEGVTAIEVDVPPSQYGRRWPRLPELDG